MPRIAGNGTEGYAGDEGPAIEAQLDFCDNSGSLALDELGQRLLIADYANLVIRQVDLSTGIITTIAGTGDRGLGDGGPAADAEFAYPVSVAVDTGGNLFVADLYTNRVRQISAGQRVAVSPTLLVGGDLFIGNTADDAEITLDAGTEPGSLMVLYNGDPLADNLTLTGSVKIIGGKNDRVVVKANLPGGLVVDAQGGSDFYTVEMGSAASPLNINDSGAGTEDNDILWVEGTDDDDVLEKTEGHITWMSPFEKSVFFSGIAHVTIDCGDGDDHVINPGGSTTILGGPGTDTIIITATADGGVTIDGQEGSDTYEIQLGSLEGNVVVADSGTDDTDTLTIVGTQDNDAITVADDEIAAAGQASVFVAASIDAMTIEGGGSADNVVVSGTPVVPVAFGIRGTDGNDEIVFSPGASSAQIQAWLNGVLRGHVHFPESYPRLRRIG